MSNSVVAVNIPPGPVTPKNGQDPANANTPAPANDLAKAVSQVAEQAIPGQATPSNANTPPKAAEPSKPPAKLSGTVTVLNWEEILKTAGVPQDLIDRVKGNDMSAFIIELLNKGYMQYLRFEEGDLPFSKEVCDELAAQKEIVTSSLETLEKTAKELSDEMTKSCLSDCLPKSNCSVNQKTAMLGVVLIAWTVLGIVGGTIVRDFPDAGLALLILGYVISGGALTAQLVNYNLSGKKEEADATAQRKLKDAEDKLEDALDSIRRILTKQQALLKRRAQHLIKDYVDATPFLNSTTKEERDAVLNQTYPAYGPNNMKMVRLKMELQAALIQHFVKNHFNRALPLIQKAMKSYIPEESEFQPEQLLENFTDTRPLVFTTVGMAISDTDMYKVYGDRLRQQTDFIPRANTATSRGQTLHSTASNAEAVRLFPLSCGSIAPAELRAQVSRGSVTSPTNSSNSSNSPGVERKNDEDEMRRPSNGSERKDRVERKRRSGSPEEERGAGIELHKSVRRRQVPATRRYMKR